MPNGFRSLPSGAHLSDSLIPIDYDAIPTDSLATPTAKKGRAGGRTGKRGAVPPGKKRSAVQAFLDFEQRTDDERHKYRVAATRELEGWIGPDEAKALKQRIADLEQILRVQKQSHQKLEDTVVKNNASAAKDRHTLSLAKTRLEESLGKRNLEYHCLLQQEWGLKVKADKEAEQRKEAEKTAENHRVEADDARNECKQWKQKYDKTIDWIDSRGDLDEFYDGVPGSPV
jgi:uncharacterized coiled-coil protein SlyX